MPHTYTSILFHLVFSIKGRAFAINEPSKLWPYVAGIAKNLHYQPYAIGGTGNHVHVLAGVPTNVSAAEAV
jgi:REP-associated tyrosine transposase